MINYFVCKFAILTTLAFSHRGIKTIVVGSAVIVIFIAVTKTALWIRRIRKQGKRREELAKLMPSDDRHHYIIGKDDYRRGNPTESYYRKTFYLCLLETFGNRCAKCGSKENGIEIDHFIFSKNEGGCFLMKHMDGYFVNNAIPLCQTCNKSKSDRSFRSFFTESELRGIFRNNLHMTKRLNQRQIFGRSGRIIRQTKMVA